MRFIHAVKFEQFFFIFFFLGEIWTINKITKTKTFIIPIFAAAAAAAAGEANEMPFKCFFISSQISKGVPHTRGGGVAETQIAQRFQQLPSAVEIEVGGHFVLGGASGGECSRTGVCRAGAGWGTSRVGKCCATVWVHRHQQLAQIASSSHNNCRARVAVVCVPVCFWGFGVRCCSDFPWIFFFFLVGGRGTAHSQPVWLVNEKLKNN